jgi:hypothetical protein
VRINVWRRRPGRAWFLRTDKITMVARAGVVRGSALMFSFASGLARVVPVVAVLVSLMGRANIALAQAKGGQAGGTAAGGQAVATAGLQGLSYSKSQWPKNLSALPTAEKLAVLCYELVYTNSAAQPFVLEPRSQIKYKFDPTRVVPCTVLDKKHHLEMDQLLVVAIDATSIDIGQLKLLNINAVDQQGISLNPSPVRPSFGASTPATNLASEKIYYLTWPNRIAGDAIRTISINAVFTPVAAGAPWAPNTFYPAGSVVTTPAAPGQYYTTLSGGISSGSPPSSWALPVPAQVAEGALIWQHIGTVLPAGVSPKSWVAMKSYSLGDVILAPNSNYYLLTQIAGGAATGVTGALPPVFNISASPSPVPESPAIQPKTDDATVQWMLKNTFHGACGIPPDHESWQPNHNYVASDVVCDPFDGTEFTALVGGVSGKQQPNFVKAFANSYQLVWTPVGTLPPATVASGQGADQTVNLLTLQLPQSHTLSYYNLAAGVVVSAVRKPTFAVPGGLMGTNTTDAQVKTSDNLTIDPVLLLTLYPIPIDAEEPCADLVCLAQDAPGLNLGLSLASPTSSFYFGFTFELFRNTELVVGENLALVPAAPKSPIPISNTATTPVTRQTFATGLFGGLSFNVSGFIQGLISGGGGATSKSASGS